MSNEAALLFQYVNTTLRADSALMAASVGGVWQGTADIGVTGPYTSFGQQSGQDSLTSAAKRVMARMLLQIVGVGPDAQYAALVVIANRIDALFGDVKNVGLPGGGVMLTSYREQPLALDIGLVAGASWSKLGGLYHIDLQSP